MSSKDIINLELRQELQTLEIVTDFFFEPYTTKNFFLELNHVYDNVRVIFHYYKDWNRTKRNAKEVLIEKEIQKPHIKPILDTLDANYNNVTATQENYNQNFTDDDQEYGQKESSKGEKEIERTSLAEIIVELAQENITKLFMNEFSSPYALVKINNHFEVLPIKNNGGRFEDYLSKLYYDNYRKVASAESINNAKRTLRAIARFEGPKTPLYLRIAWTNPDDKNAIYYDLTDENRRCVKITKGEGWEIVENQIEILFNRFGHELPQVEPSHDYDSEVLDRFVDALNLSNESDKIVIKVWIVSLLIPEIGIPMLLPVGPEGSAKTSLQKKIRKLIDPSSYDPFSINNDKIQFIQQLSHNFLCFYDNVRYEPNWLSDETCRSITGASSSKRELYTDDEDIPYKYKKRMSFSGINNIFQQPDAQDRSIRVELERLDPKEKIEEDVIENELKQQTPQLLGYILDIISKALEIKESIILEGEDKPRMVDFAKWGEAIGRAMGYKPKTFLNAYFENIGKQKIEIIENDPFTEALTRFIDYDIQSWKSPLPIFIQHLKQYADENNIDSSKFPKKPQTISNKLRKAKATLLEGLGIEIIVDRITSGVGNNKKLKNTAIIKIRKRSPLPPPPPLNQNDEGNSRDIGGELLTSSGDQISTQTETSPPENTQIPSQIDNELVKSGDGGDGGDHFRNLSEPVMEEESKKLLLFINPLISKSDLSIGGPHDPDIINNIDRVHPNSDRWFCTIKDCKWKGDKWFMMTHPCKKNNLKNGDSKHN